MDRDLYQKMLVDLVLPDIKKKMPVNTNIISHVITKVENVHACAAG
jgi:hypothetical protein